MSPALARAAVFLLALLQRAQGVTIVSPMARTRDTVRAQLLDSLSQQPVEPEKLHALAEELETLAALPATADFHLLGLRGSWSERLQSVLSIPPEDAVPELTAAQQELVCVDDVVQHFEEGVLRSVATFRVPSETIAGSFEVQATIYPTTMSNMLHLVTTGHTLNLNCSPKDVEVPQLLEALMGRLGPEFRAEEAVRTGTQTTYIDEELRISRCTTRHLAGFLTVHSRCPAQ